MIEDRAVAATVGILIWSCDIKKNLKSKKQLDNKVVKHESL